MAIFVVGINHKTAPLELRERIYFAADQLPLYLQDLTLSTSAKQAVLLSTCNRSELYCDAHDLTKVKNWFAAQTDVSSAILDTLTYIYRDGDAVSHMMSVACGLDSMVLGEPQILGQMKAAFSESCAASVIGPSFHRLFQHIFTVAKEIRTTTAIGACPVSMVSAAVNFVKSRIKDFSNAKVVVVGAGDTAALLLRYLYQQLQKPVVLINRTPEKAFLVSKSYDAQVCGFEGLALQLKSADVVFTMTGSPHPIINQAMVEEAIQSRHHDRAKLMFIDIAVPRDIDPAVGQVKNVSLYCIDDLKSIIEQNRRGREHAKDKALEHIRQSSATVIEEYQSFDHVAYTIRAYRNQIEVICQQEIDKAKQELNKGYDPNQVLEMFARAYTNKLLHGPSVQLRKASGEGRLELLRYAKQLFALPDQEAENL